MSKKILLLITSVLILSSCKEEELKSEIEKKQEIEKIEISDLVLKVDNEIDNNQLLINYPEIIKGLNSQNDKDEINNYFLNIKNFLKEEFNLLEQNSKIENNYNYFTNYKNKTLSFYNEMYFYYGKVNGYNYIDTYVFDLNEGKRLKLEDLFYNENFTDELDILIKEELRKKDTILMNEFKGITKEQNFILEEDFLSIYFQQNEIGPSVLGIIEIKINKKNIHNIKDFYN